MRVLLKPDIAHALGVVLLKPGKELMSLFTNGRRILIQSEPKNMVGLSSGRVPDTRQPLAEDPRLTSFFTDKRVVQAAGGINSLESWLLKKVKKCQWPHAEYHHHELVAMRHEPGAIAVCWSCDNKLRDHTTEQLQAMAQSNTIPWVIDSIRMDLRLDNNRELSISEVCWWAIRRGISDAVTDEVARQAFHIPAEVHRGTHKESDTVPSVPESDIYRNRVAPYINREPPAPKQKPVVILTVDPESPQTFFAKPKRIRWESTKYLKWVKTQSCACCGKPTDDAHHLIGWGQGGMGTKAHDIFTIPLCRKHHDELHRDPKVFEQKHGTQPEMIIKLLDRAYALGVLA